MTTLAPLNEPVLAQAHQDQVLGTKGQKAQTKRQRQETEDQGEGKGT